MDVAPTGAAPNEVLRRREAVEETLMDELNGRLIVCQILITGLIAAR